MLLIELTDKLENIRPPDNRNGTRIRAMLEILGNLVRVAVNLSGRRNSK